MDIIAVMPGCECPEEFIVMVSLEMLEDAPVKAHSAFLTGSDEGTIRCFP